MGNAHHALLGGADGRPAHLDTRGLLVLGSEAEKLKGHQSLRHVGVGRNNKRTSSTDPAWRGRSPAIGTTRWWRDHIEVHDNGLGERDGWCGEPRQVDGEHASPLRQVARRDPAMVGFDGPLAEGEAQP
jgi:hypothetical protein